MNIQDWFPLRLTGLGFSRVFSSTTVWKHQFFTSLWSNSHICTWLLGKAQLWLYWPMLAKWCLCFLIHCLDFSFQGASIFYNFKTAVTICSDFGAKENKICHCFHFFSIFHEVMGPDARILLFWMLSFKPAFLLSSFTFIKKFFIPLHFLPLEWCIICIFEVVDFSPCNLDSSLWFIQPSVSHDVLCIAVK